MNHFSFLFLILLLGNFTGCKNPAPKATIANKEGTGRTDTLTLSGKDLVIHWGKNGLPEKVSPLDKGGLQDGYTMEYGGEGALWTISQWENGKQDGNTFVFDQGKVTTHQLFDTGKLIYQGKYENRIKADNQLYPQFVEEFFFEDKYYAKIRFPLAYKGQLKVQVIGYQAIISPLPDQTFQLVINDALDLNGYDLKLTYHSAAQDTLVGSEYTFTHIVYEN